MKTGKRLLSLLLCCMFLLSSASCAGSTETKSTASTVIPQYDSSEKVVLKNVYYMEEVYDLPQELTRVDAAAPGENGYYISGNYVRYEEQENGRRNKTAEGDIIYFYDENLQTYREVFSTDYLDYSANAGYYEFAQVSKIASTGDGNLLILLFHVNSNEINKTRDRFFSILLIDSEGNELYSYDKLNTYIKSKLGGNGTFVNIKYFAADSKHILFCDYQNIVYVANEKGEHLFDVTPKESVTGLFFLEDGTGAVAVSESATMLKLVDFKKKSASKNYMLPSYYENPTAADGNSVYLTAVSGLIKYDVKTGESDELINWSNSCIDSSKFTMVFPVNEDFLAVEEMSAVTENGEPTMNCVFSRLTPVPESELGERYVLSYACDYISDEIKAAITKFNRTHTDYLIQPVLYTGSGEGSSSPYQSASTALDLDIISGNVPDIFSNTGENFDKYAKKGILADLTELFESDPDIDISDFLTNVFEALKVDDKLYYVTPAFQIATLIGKKDLIGEKTSWSFEEMQTLLETNLKEGENVSKKAFYGYKAQNVFKMLMMFLINDFVDFENGVCDFDTESFKEIVDFCKNFKTSGSLIWSDINNLETSIYKNDRYLLYFAGIGEIRDIVKYEDMFGEEIAFIGFPGSCGSLITPIGQIGISSSMMHKEAAWEFVKMLLSEDFQDNIPNLAGSPNLPVRISSLEKQAEEAKTAQYSAFTGMRTCRAASDEEIETLMNLLKSVHYELNDEQNQVIDIVCEETEDCLTGHSKLQSTVKSINSKISILLSEKSS